MLNAKYQPNRLCASGEKVVSMVVIIYGHDGHPDFLDHHLFLLNLV